MRLAHATVSSMVVHSSNVCAITNFVDGRLSQGRRGWGVLFATPHGVTTQFSELWTRQSSRQDFYTGGMPPRSLCLRAPYPPIPLTNVLTNLVMRVVRPVCAGAEEELGEADVMIQSGDRSVYSICGAGAHLPTIPKGLLPCSAEACRSCGATVHGTYGTAEAGTCTAYVQCVAPRRQAVLRLRYVHHAGGW